MFSMCYNRRAQSCAVRCLSVCMSVCHVPASNSKTQSCKKCTNLVEISGDKTLVQRSRSCGQAKMAARADREKSTSRLTVEHFVHLDLSCFWIYF